MLYVIQKGYNRVKAVDPKYIVYCISSVQNVIDANIDFVYTDGHTTDSFSSYFEPKSILKIKEQIDLKATNVVFWKDENDLDLKRRKEAEFLIKQDLEYSNILGFATFYNDSRNKLIKLGIEEKKVVVKPNFYGPYSGKVKHVFNYLNGSYIMGYAGKDKKPFEQLNLLVDSEKAVGDYINANNELKQIVLTTNKFLTGFYSSFGLELLSTVDYISQENNLLDKDLIKEKLHNWSDRKKTLFAEDRYVDISINHLKNSGLIK